MRTSVLVAVTGGATTTMLLAIAATGGLGALTDDDAASSAPSATVADATDRAEPAPVVVKVELPVKPIVLPSGAPACGNVMTKYAAPKPLTRCPTGTAVLDPAAASQGVTSANRPGRYQSRRRDAK